ncbi:MAG: hypothetical protein RLZZ338_4707 [Cyanobacteriota bacterium]|jgi:hypothetical protein
MDNKCPEIYCPWVRDTQDADHYCCLRCGKDRWVNRSSNSNNDWWLWILLFFIALIIAIMMG